MNETDAPEKKSFWNTTLGAITKITALLTAITALILAVRPFINSGKDNNSGGSSIADNTNSKPEATVDYLSIATTLANDWCSDYKKRNIDGLVVNSSIPFYADSKILNSLSEVRQSYDETIPNFAALQSQKDSTGKSEMKMEVAELKIYKISELKTKGYDVSGDRIIRSLNLEEDPYIALVRFNTWHDYTELVFRKTGNTLKIAGWWN
jgi:hypothetical protein